MFGPNSFSHFSAKKNQDIMMPLTSVLSQDQITEYIESWLAGMFTKPDLALFYPQSTEETVDSAKKIATKQFALT